jgi:hypothetical protein
MNLSMLLVVNAIYHDLLLQKWRKFGEDKNIDKFDECLYSSTISLLYTSRFPIICKVKKVSTCQFLEIRKLSKPTNCQDNHFYSICNTDNHLSLIVSTLTCSKEKDCVLYP